MIAEQAGDVLSTFSLLLLMPLRMKRSLTRLLPHATADQPKVKCAWLRVGILTWTSPGVCFGRLEYSGWDSYFDSLCGVLR
jgi:hypothetical protein